MPTACRPPTRRLLLGAALLAGLLPPGGAQDLPLRITSSESQGELQGKVQATTPFGFEAVREALSRPAVWCEILMLHLNNKSCRLEQGAAGPAIALAIARKHDQSARQAHALQLQWRLQESSAQRIAVRLDAADGPFGTTDYVVLLTAEPDGAGRTAIAFSYACRFSRAARLALQTYLSTLGRDKVGFTTEPASGGPRLVGGLRGVVERTAMRYYLAIEAWLQAATLPAGERAVARLENWFDATERYPRQLHELEKAEYMAGKRRELGLAP